MTSRVVVLGDVDVDVVAVHDGPLAHRQRHARADLAAPRRRGRRTSRRGWRAPASRWRWSARVGDDALARGRAARRWTASTCASRVDPDAPTGTCVVLVAPGGERTMLPDPGANDALTADDLPDDVFAEGAILHVSGYALLRPGSRGAALDGDGRARATPGC